jgi:kynurenine formamidase
MRWCTRPASTSTSPIETLCNLQALLGQGQFTFIGLPMKWRDGTASPIRAVAVFGM